jgi:hypothetical protein
MARTASTSLFAPFQAITNPLPAPPPNELLLVTEENFVMEKSSTVTGQMSNYRVKGIEPIMVGSDVQARLFTLAPGETIPWHFHRASADHYFVLFEVEPPERQVLEAIPSIELRQHVGAGKANEQDRNAA